MAMFWPKIKLFLDFFTDLSAYIHQAKPLSFPAITNLAEFAKMIS